MTRGPDHKGTVDRPAPSRGESTDPDRATWRPPTRRVFVAMLGAAAAALALREQTPVEPERPRSTWAGKTRWIGHC